MANYKLRNKDLYVGKEIRAKFATNPDAYIFGGVYLPLRIIAEYPEWWLTEVLPHRNEKSCYGLSKPYRMTIRKWDVECGDVTVKENK